MKSGMEMMLESMGIQTGAIKQLLDPANVKALLTKIETMCNTVEAIMQSNASLYAAILRIELKLGTLPEDVQMKLLEDCQSQAFKDAVEYVRDYNGNSGDSNKGNGSDSRSINADSDGSGNGRGL